MKSFKEFLKERLSSVQQTEQLKLGDEYEGGVIGGITEKGEYIIVAPKKYTNTIMNYKSAKAYCADLTIEGYSDWRLPTKKEGGGVLQDNWDVWTDGVHHFWTSTSASSSKIYVFSAIVLYAEKPSEYGVYVLPIRISK